MNYYRRYVGDYLRDTARLSILEHGAYNLLLDYYYAEERPLAPDLNEIYRMVRAMLPEERRAVDRILTSYFIKQDDGYHNARADEEIAKGNNAIEQMSDAGRRGAERRWGKAKEADAGGNGGVDAGGDGVGHRVDDAGDDTSSNHQPPTTNHHPPTTSISPPNGGDHPTLELLPSNIPYREIVALYNEHMDKLPKVRELNNDRRKMIRTAWAVSKKRQSLAFWKAYFEECSEDNFLNGTGPYRNGHENWTPDFDYLMRPKVITKTYEKAMSRSESS